MLDRRVHERLLGAESFFKRVWEEQSLRRWDRLRDTEVGQWRLAGNRVQRHPLVPPTPPPPSPPHMPIMHDFPSYGERQTRAREQQ